jgi:hypothetical protein
MKQQMKSQKISERIYVEKPNPHEVYIEIDQKIPRWQESMLLVWLMAWTFCGGVFVYYAFQPGPWSDRIFFIISTSAWAYFFVRIAKVFLWRRMGKEKIWIRTGEMEIQNSIGKWGKKEKFKLANIQKLGMIKQDPGNFFVFLDNSFWIIGGDKIGFVHGSTPHRIGKQLSVRESDLLLKVVDSAVKAFSK